MSSWLLALVLKPLVVIAFNVLVVAPATYLVYKLVPDGRLKQALLKDRFGPDATQRDKRIVVVLGAGMMAIVVALSWLGHR